MCSVLALLLLLGHLNFPLGIHKGLSYLWNITCWSLQIPLWNIILHVLYCHNIVLWNNMKVIDSRPFVIYFVFIQLLLIMDPQINKPIFPFPLGMLCTPQESGLCSYYRWNLFLFYGCRRTAVAPQRVHLRLWPGISLPVLTHTKSVPDHRSDERLSAGLTDTLPGSLPVVFPRVTPPCWIVAVGTPRSRRSSWPAPMMGECFFKSLSYCGPTDKQLCGGGVTHLLKILQVKPFSKWNPFIWNALFL